MKQRYKVKIKKIENKKLYIVLDTYTSKEVGSAVPSKGHAESLAMVWNEIQRDLRKPL